MTLCLPLLVPATPSFSSLRIRSTASSIVSALITCKQCPHESVLLQITTYHLFLHLWSFDAHTDDQDQGEQTSHRWKLIKFYFLSGEGTRSIVEPSSCSFASEMINGRKIFFYGNIVFIGNMRLANVIALVLNVEVYVNYWPPFPIGLGFWVVHATQYLKHIILERSSGKPIISMPWFWLEKLQMLLWIINLIISYGS